MLRLGAHFLLHLICIIKDAQLVGVEVDILNYAKAGIPPNASKVGQQLVTIGDFNSSAALEILSDHKSRWQNGILFQDGSISTNGTAIAIANKEPIKFGIDASQTQFSDSAILLKKNDRISFRAIQGNPNKNTFITSDDFDDGYVVIGGGVRIVTPDDKFNILKISQDGSISPESLVIKRYWYVFVMPWLFGIISLGVSFWVLIKCRKEK